MIRAEPVSAATETQALAYLAQAPYDNVFLTYILLFDTASSTRKATYLALDTHGAICGVAYFGRQVVIAANDDETVAAFAEIAKHQHHHHERMIVGPRPTIQKYWSIIESWHPAPRVVRERQFVMKLQRAHLSEYPKNVLARKARMDEWTQVADNSALMIAQELEYDPRRSSPEFTANVRAMIDRGLWWVGESLGRLCFFCNVGPWSPQTAQMQGIWTPKDLRGKGLANAAMGAICDRLLMMTPTLSLYVNDFNTPAIALYERLGFETVSEFQTLLF